LTQKTTTESSAPRSAVNLISVYERPDRYEILYELLKERDERVNISHRELPTWANHIKFVNSKPYEGWYFICAPEPVGTVYLTPDAGPSRAGNEIGVFIFAEHQKRGYARDAVKALMAKHGARRYLANVNPANDGSKFLFSGMGFRLVQHTYALEGA
jgi:RimJ/RimL family protein N-acetyltransferase